MCFDDPRLQPDASIKLDFNVVEPLSLLPCVSRRRIAEQNPLAIEHRVQHSGILVSLVEGRQHLEAKPRVVVDGGGFDVVVEDAYLFVRIADANVDVEVVNKHIVVIACEIELCEGGVLDVDFDLVWPKDEPYDECDDAKDNNDGNN